jgi:hypothetical protein
VRNAQYRRIVSFRPSSPKSPSLRAELDRFREAVVVAQIEDEAAGHPSVCVGRAETESGPWWRRTPTDPQWGADRAFSFEEAFDGTPPRIEPPFEGGVDEDEDSFFDQLLASSVDSRGRLYSLRRIDRSDEPERWAENDVFVPQESPHASLTDCRQDTP